MAYKSFQKEGSWIETETEVSDPKAMVLILNSINHHQYLKIKKVRISTFINKIEINLDSIENLGTFLELEKIGKNFEKERNSLIKFAREILELKVSTIIDKGYVQMMEEKIK